jgi:dUTP pyrophosphatase
MAKRFYKVNEKIWLKELNKVGKVVELDVPNLKLTATYFVGKDELKTGTFAFTDIDKLRTNESKSLVINSKGMSVTGNIVFPKEKQDTILFAKVRPDAIIPSKNFEDAGYDLYANFDVSEMRISKNKPTLIPTGIAMSMLPKYYANLKHERGSTSLIGMAVLAGVVDSGFRSEVFVNITPLYKDIVISKNVKTTVENEDEIIYPYSKAICQFTVDFVPDLKSKEITYEQLKAIPSKRGDGQLGSSDK